MDATVNANINQALQFVLQGLGLIIISIVAYGAWQVKKWLQAKAADSKWASLIEFGTAAVQAAEQMLQKGQLINVKAAKEKAIEFLQSLADAHGIKIDVNAAEALIESLLLQGVHQGWDESKPVPTTPESLKG